MTRVHEEFRSDKFDQTPSSYATFQSPGRRREPRLLDITVIAIPRLDDALFSPGDQSEIYTARAIVNLSPLDLVRRVALMHIEEETYRDAFSRARPLQSLAFPTRPRSKPAHANLSSVRVDVRDGSRYPTRGETLR